MLELVARAVIALSAAHLLPGWLLVHGLGMGRSRLERWVMAAVAGGPLAAFFYWMSLVSGETALYWALIGTVDLAALVALYRSRRRRVELGAAKRPLVGLAVLVAIVGITYHVTTGTLFRPGNDGELLLDQALQRDTLFHVGMVRSLLASYPPEVLSFSGVEASYHVVYHLQIAAWSRFFGIDVFDGIYRVGMQWSLALLILSTFLLGRRFAQSERAGLLSAVLLFGAGLGFLWTSSPSVDWWSLSFMDVTLVSVFLVNPLLPALPLLFCGLLCLEGYADTGRRGVLVGCAVFLVTLFRVKVFLGAQAIGGVVLAGMLFRRGDAKRLRIAAGILALCALPLMAPMLLGGGAGNTAIGLRPLEIVRYSMEKLEWSASVRALAEVGQWNVSAEALGWAAMATLIWAIGFLGLRLVALPGWVTDVLSPSGPVRSSMAYSVLLGFPIALLIRIAPVEATGLSRLEAINDVIWFAAQSGILLWFWTAETVVRFAERSRLASAAAVTAVLVFALPCTVQHFVYKQTLEVDRVPAEAVEAARAVKELSAPGDVWVEPPSRVRPSLVAYLAGRPVVHDGYVGYDYMFVPREDLEFRRHAVAQFWRTKDPAYARWFIEFFDVRGVWVTRDVRLRRAVKGQVEPAFDNSTTRLYRTVESTGDLPELMTPERLPLGLNGAPYFGKGWGKPGSRRVRELRPGNAMLYIPIQEDRDVSLEMDVETPHPEGQLTIGEMTLAVGREQSSIRLALPPFGATGLQQVGLRWAGRASLTVKRIQLKVD
jgi:hypothetical protein